MKLFAIFLLCLIVASCSTVSLVSIPNSTNSAVLQLLESAKDAEAEGRYERAISDLERALRIEPDNAYIWYVLADMHQQQGNLIEAESMAKRALTYAEDARLRKNIELLIDSL